MKVMLASFAFAIALAVGVYALMQTSYQRTASVSFSTTGADLREAAGENLVGKDWYGVGRPH